MVCAINLVLGRWLIKITLPLRGRWKFIRKPIVKINGQ